MKEKPKQKNIKKDDKDDEETKKIDVKVPQNVDDVEGLEYIEE